MGQWRIGAAAVVLALVLAGCSGGGNDSDDVADPSPLIDDALTGTVEGIVVDEAFTALEGVEVGMPKADRSARTGPDGRFRLAGLEPGTYDLFANKLGYAPFAQKVQVEAGSVLPLDVVLSPQDLDEVYHETTEFVGFINCGLGSPAGRATSACTQDPNHKIDFGFEVQPNLRTAVGELTWEPSASFAARSLSLVLWQNPSCSPCRGEYEYGESEGPSPVALRADAFRGLDAEEPTTLYWYVWTPFSSDESVVVVVINQRFAIQSSVFYGEAAPADFTAIPDE